MKRRTDKDLTREELIDKLAATRRKLRWATVELRLRQDEVLDLRRAEAERTSPHRGPLQAVFAEVPLGLSMTFDRDVRMLLIDEPTARGFVHNVNRWLQKLAALRAAPDARPHLSLVKEPDHDG